MTINISKLLQNDYFSEQFSVTELPDSIKVSEEEYKVLYISPMRISLMRSGEKLKAVYSGEADVIIPCARCLEPVNYRIKFDGERETEMKLLNEDADDEFFFIIDKEIHPDLLFIDELLIHWPIRVLCKEDCKGICSRCGTNLNKAVCNCDKEVPDPRMAAIRDIFSQFKEV